MGEARRRRESNPNYGKGISAYIDNSILGRESFTESDYQALVDEYIQCGGPSLFTKIQELAELNNILHTLCKQVAGELILDMDKVNDIANTVYILASKQSKMLSSRESKLGKFILRIPAEPSDYGKYPPVYNNPELALEGMRLFNTGFFNSSITRLINSEGDIVSTLRKCVVIIYMGTNDSYEITDAACALAKLKPFEIICYVGEQRSSLNSRIENVFKPMASEIENFRISEKGSDKYPCLSLLCLVENKVNFKVCEFRKHYTAQGGNQLMIPGFSSQIEGLQFTTPLTILGSPLKVPSIRGID